MKVEVVGVGLLVDEVVEDELGDRPLVLLLRALTEARLDRRISGVAGLSLVQGDVEAAVAGMARAGVLDGSVQAPTIAPACNGPSDRSSGRSPGSPSGPVPRPWCRPSARVRVTSRKVDSQIKPGSGR